MDIQIIPVGFSIKDDLQEFAHNKVSKLERFSDDIISAEVFFRLLNNSEDNNKCAEIKLLVRGHDLFAKKESKTFEESLNLAIEALRKQLEKRKDKKKS